MILSPIDCAMKLHLSVLSSVKISVVFRMLEGDQNFVHPHHPHSDPTHHKNDDFVRHYPQGDPTHHPFQSRSNLVCHLHFYLGLLPPPRLFHSKAPEFNPNSPNDDDAHSCSLSLKNMDFV